MPEPPNLPNDPPDHPPPPGHRPSDPNRQSPIVNPQPDTDLLDASTPFDPAQWAMHGLLSVYFEGDEADQTRKADAILARIATELGKTPVPAEASVPCGTGVSPVGSSARESTGETPVPQTSQAPIPRSAPRSIYHRLRPFRWPATALAIAAAVLIAVIFLWPPKGGQAQAQDLREFGFAPPIAFIGLWPDLNDEAAMRTTEQAVAKARTRLSEALALRDWDILDPWRPWTQLYRNLSTLGKWEEARAEAHGFVTYAAERYKEPERFSGYYMGLSDLGKIYLAVGDYENARRYYEKSLDVGRDYHEWYYASGPGSDHAPYKHASAFAVTSAPRHWTLSTLAAAQEDRKTAWNHYNQAGDLLADVLRKYAAHLGLSLPPEASLEIHWTAAASADPNSPETRSFAVYTRQHRLHQAMLLRLDRNPDAAAEAIDAARAIPDYPHADDFRQDFNLPMEALRIGIARGEFPAALAAADEAADNTGPRHFEGFPTHPPLGILARAELRFLRGVALLGMDREDPDALTLIELAIEVVQQSAGSLPEAQRKKLLDRFSHWNDIAEGLR